jgi:hypothetical protein
MMRDIVSKALSQCPDVTLVPEDSQFDVLLVPAPDPDDAAGVLDLLWRWPGKRVIAIGCSGRVAVIYELHPHKTSLRDLSPATLVDAVCH